MLSTSNTIDLKTNEPHVLWRFCIHMDDLWGLLLLSRENRKTDYASNKEEDLCYSMHTNYTVGYIASYTKEGHTEWLMQYMLHQVTRITQSSSYISRTQKKNLQYPIMHIYIYIIILQRTIICIKEPNIILLRRFIL